MDEKRSKPSEHLMIAEEMVSQIMSRFNPLEQNEVLGFIIENVARKRKDELKEAEKRFIYLKDCFSSLPQNR